MDHPSFSPQGGHASPNSHGSAGKQKRHKVPKDLNFESSYSNYMKILNMMSCIEAVGEILKRALFGVVWGLALPAWGQEPPRLVNTDSGVVLPSGNWQLATELRSFGAKEGNTYGSLLGFAGLGNGYGASFKFVAGRTLRRTEQNFQVRYGGTDVELQIRRTFAGTPGFSLALGLATPSTPSQKRPMITSSAIYRLPIEPVSVYIGVRNEWRDRNSTAALTLGSSYRINPRWSVCGDLSLLVKGDNAFELGSAKPQRTGLFGVGFQYAATDRTSLSVGVTNALGVSTGFGTSPSLGNVTGLFFGVTVRGGK